VTQPLLSLFRLRPFQPRLPVASSQLPENPQNQLSVARRHLQEAPQIPPLRFAPVGMTDLQCQARHDRAKSERRKANCGTQRPFKSLSCNILPITPTGSIFCGESFLIVL